MKRLGDVVLPRALEWPDRLTGNRVIQTLRLALSGRAVMSATAMSHRPVTLIARDGVAWFDAEQVVAVLSMADQPGSTWLLEWAGTVQTVAFRHHEPPAANFTPLWPNAPRFTGEIKLIVV